MNSCVSGFSGSRLLPRFSSSAMTYFIILELSRLNRRPVLKSSPIGISYTGSCVYSVPDLYGTGCSSPIFSSLFYQIVVILFS